MMDVTDRHCRYLLRQVAAGVRLYTEMITTGALIHGDVWTGNVLAENGRITGFLDPAPYYAHHEVELAFITLFGTFGEAFFARYGEVGTRIDAEFWETRRRVYNVYPLLVHVRLFGGGYVGELSANLDMLGF